MTTSLLYPRLKAEAARSARIRWLLVSFGRLLKSARGRRWLLLRESREVRGGECRWMAMIMRRGILDGGAYGGKNVSEDTVMGEEPACG